MNKKTSALNQRKYQRPFSVTVKFVLFVLLTVGVLGFGGSVRAATLIDFDDGLFYRTAHGYNSHFDSEYYDFAVSALSPPGLLGTDHCMLSYVETDYHDQSYHHWIEDSSQGTFIGEADGMDRFSFYALLPSNVDPTGYDSTFHVGTYTSDGNIGQGRHYYHYFRPYGSTYPVHLLCNEHPQNWSGHEDEIEDNPETWDYMSGWTRFYISFLGNRYDDASYPYYVYYDQFKFYAIAESENQDTVNNLWVVYMGSDAWHMGFAMNCQHTFTDCVAKMHNYQVRYSTSPITNANFASATVAGTFNYDSSTWNQVPVSFDITSTDDSGATQYYFAVDDLDDGSGYVSKIDYEFGTEEDTSPPSRSNPQPTGTLSSGTTSATISLDTDETATCKYSETSNTAYDDMTLQLSSGQANTHTATVSNLENGNSYTYYVRCQDESGNQNPDDFEISFSIASSTTYSISNFINLVTDWLKSESGLESDVNGDGVVNTRDLGIMMSNWGE